MLLWNNMMRTHGQYNHFYAESHLVVEKVLTKAEAQVLKVTLAQLELYDNRQDVSISWTECCATYLLNLRLQSGPLLDVQRYLPVLRLVEQLAGVVVRTTVGLLLDKTPEHNFYIG